MTADTPRRRPRANTVARAAMHRIRARRRELGWSVERLAQATTAAGYPLSRGALATAESSTRAGLPVDLLVAAADALGTSPINLLALGPCPSCNGAPPAGFKCVDCGWASTRREQRTRGWVRKAADDADTLVAECRTAGTSLADLEQLRLLVHDVADEAMRLQQVVADKDRRLAEAVHPRRPHGHARGAAS